MGPYLLEVCVDSVESAMIATRGGADRIELCSNLIIGGTTPGIALYREARRYTDTKIFTMIRPRFGDFLYTEHEFACMQQEVELFCKEGTDGIVIGCLREDGSLHMEQMKALIKQAGTKQITLHRAFDMCKDPVETLEQAIELGVTTILTSGQQENCLKGMSMISQLNELARGRLKIMAGGGVNAEVIRQYKVQVPALTTFHMSGKKIIESNMNYRSTQVHMGLPGISEYEIQSTDEEAVRAAKRLMK